MASRQSRFPQLLTAAETAAPVEAVDVFAENLRRRFGATQVSFLIVDLTGRAVARLTTTTAATTVGHDADHIPMLGSVYGQVIRAQRLYQEATGEGHRVITPVTNRGDAIGLLEIILPTRPDENVLQAVGEAAHLLAYVVIANGRFTDLYTWGKRTKPPPLRRRSSTSCCPSRCRAKARSSRCAEIWSLQQTSAETPSTTPSSATSFTCR